MRREKTNEVRKEKKQVIIRRDHNMEEQHRIDRNGVKAKNK